ncbi:MAG TPA: VOC family protein [Thermoanaerobaculia bacterium]|nr:VOC family protein [Thermoanaerobaculia bacterium]
MPAPRLFETCLYAPDLAATVDFYRRVFGLEVISDFSPRGAALRCASGVLLIFCPERTREFRAERPEIPLHGAEGSGHVAFLAAEEELPAWRARLADLGIEIESEVDWPEGGRSIYLRDPAGNSVELAPPTLWGGGWDAS